jgi:hypothetical protein
MSNERSHIRLFDGALIKVFPVRDIWIEDGETGKWPFRRKKYTLCIDSTEDPPEMTRWMWEFSCIREAEKAQARLVESVMSSHAEFGIKIPAIVLTPQH